MEKAKKEAIMNARTFDELLDAEYGKAGTPEREQFDTDSVAFCLAETLKEERMRAGLTQKTYISRLENGKADVQLGTLFRIFEGLGRRVSLTIL